MEVRFADTFGKSLSRLIKRQRWYWRTYDFLRYDIPRFVKNIIRFRKALWNFYDFDMHGSLLFMKICIIEVRDAIEFYGNEVKESRDKKIAKMNRAIEILDHHIENDFVEMAEELLGHKLSPLLLEELDENGKTVIRLKESEDKNTDKSILALAVRLEKETWKELFEILRGQDFDEFNEMRKNAVESDKKEDDAAWNKWFTGAGLKTWWD